MSYSNDIPHRELYYITHIDNLESILKNGIFSHERISMEGINHAKIYDNNIVVNRSEILTPDGKDLWAYANIYLQPRNPMLYRVISEIGVDKIAILGIKKTVLDIPNIFVSNGNAASSYSEIKPIKELKKTYREIRKDLQREYWLWQDGSKRKIMAEILIPDLVPAEYINSIYVANSVVRDEAKSKISTSKVPIIPEPMMFFQPKRIIPITENLDLADGDLFFSDYQTIIISVNCVGVMGKGIASRAKYQFPDVYVYYQDLCRSRKIKYGKPYLYKRESSFTAELADEPDTMTNGVQTKWFLLFPTKDHWRNDSSLEGIEAGLHWVLKNYKKNGIQSLSLPALGCGLGNLKWKEAGPVMCGILSQLDIPVRIYLPLEKDIRAEYLTKFHCLKRH